MADFVLATTTLIAWILSAYVVTQNDPVRSAFALAVIFACAAVHWLFLNSPFLAVLLLLVYLGAVMVFFLFIVMTLPKKNEKSKEFAAIKMLPPLGIALSIALPIAQITAQPPSQQQVINAYTTSDLKMIAALIFEDYGVLLQYLGVALFITMLVAVSVLNQTKEPQHD